MNRERLEHIRCLLDTGKYHEALRDLQDPAVAIDDSDLVAHSVALKLDALAGLGRWEESVAFGASVLPKLVTGLDRASLGRIHGLLGFSHLRLGDLRRSELHLRAAIHIATWDVGDTLEVLRHQRRLGLLFLSRALWRQAGFEFEKAIEIAEEQKAERESAALRVNLAVTYIKAGRLAGIIELLEPAEKVLASNSQAKWLANTHLVRANYLRITGHPAKALELLVPALQTTREQQYSREEAITLEYIGDCHLAQKEYKKALDHYEQAMKIAEATAPGGDLVPEVCQRLAETLVNLGDPNQAILLCERGLRVARAISDRYEECATHRVFAMSHRAAGNPRKALRIAEEGIDLGRQYEIPYELGRTLAWVGEVRLQDSSSEEKALGRRQIWEARGIFDRMGLPLWVRAMERLLGLDSQPELPKDEPGFAAVSDLADLDRGAFRFGIVTCDRRVIDAVAIIQSVAPSQIPVMISGESGVGKELLAQALHKISDRRKGPFVPINCAAISVSLMDSEFFGHERGAFTGAITSREGLLLSADGGTLFLDEIGELPPPVQASLLRVLESGELRAVGRDEVRTIDIRIVAATNARLEDLVARGLFRQDLFYRLNGVRVSIPPLREREEDIRALFRYFWSQACATAKKTLRVAEDVEALLCAYDWPGNVRELKHEIARAVALAPDGSLVERDAFLPQLDRKDAATLRLGRERRDVAAQERDQILLALRAHRGNKAEAARSLGEMKRTTLIYKMERLGIRPEEYEVRE